MLDAYQRNEQALPKLFNVTEGQRRGSYVSTEEGECIRHYGEYQNVHS